MGKLKVKLVDGDVPTLWNESDGLHIPLMPLVQIESGDRWAQRVLERMRKPPPQDQSGSQSAEVGVFPTTVPSRGIIRL